MDGGAAADVTGKNLEDGPVLTEAATFLAKAMTGAAFQA